MPYGTRYMLLKQGNRPRWKHLRRIFAMSVGAIEPHSHIRWAAAKRAFRRIPGAPSRVLEVSTGSGEMAYELVSLLHPQTLATFDIVRPPSDVHDVCACFQADATSIPIVSSSQCLVVALDVIEHILNDRLALAEMHRVLIPGGHLVVSVPTPAYPRFFGRDFHVSLGHVRDGYTAGHLRDALVDTGFNVELIRGHTSIAFLLFAALYYRLLRRNVFLSAPAVALSKPLLLVDRLLPSPVWGGLIAVGRKAPARAP